MMRDPPPSAAVEPASAPDPAPPVAPVAARRRWVWLLLGACMSVALFAAIAALVLLARQRDQGARDDLQILQGVRKVCKLATVEVSLADYSRRKLPKKFDLPIDLPFTGASEAYLFYAGVVSAGFDVCDEPSQLVIDHATRTVTLSLPPPRVLSLDIKRFEIINENSTFLNSIEPADRNQWYQDARQSLEAGALRSGVLEKAQGHARELFESFVERWGYRLKLSVQAAPGER